MITVVDYGLGNIRAFLDVYKRLDIEARTAQTAEQLEGASRLILPGVGAFDDAMERLEHSGMRGILEKMVLQQHIPVLGVCVGMQMLARASDEGVLRGLGWIDATVRAFALLRPARNLPLPHMGWNDVRPVPGGRLFRELEMGGRFYFLHSYYVECERSEDTLALCSYGVEFSAAVCVGNIYGVQFHPEKSHGFGIQLLKNFAEL